MWSPIAAQTRSQWTLLLSAWNDAALGVPNAVPSLNPLAWMKLAPALVLHGGASETFYLSLAVLCAVAGVYAIARRRLALSIVNATIAAALYAGSGFVFSKVSSGQSSYWSGSAAFIWGCYFLLGPRGLRNTARAGFFFALSTLMLQFTAFSAVACAVYAIAFARWWALRRAAAAAFASFVFAFPAIVRLAQTGPALGADIPPPTRDWEHWMSPRLSDALSYFTYAGEYPERALQSLGAAGQAALHVQHWAAIIVALLSAVLLLGALWMRIAGNQRACEPLFLGLMGAAGIVWMTGLSGPAGPLWRLGFEHEAFTNFFREFFHAAILFALPVSLLPPLLAQMLPARFRQAGPAVAALLAICAGIATWSGGFARILPFVHAAPYERAVVSALANREGTVLFLPAIQPLAVPGDTLGGNDIFDWAGPQMSSLYRYHVDPAVAYVLARLRAGDAAAAKTMLERIACDAVVVRPGVVSRAPYIPHNGERLNRTLRRAFGRPQVLPGGALLYRVDGMPLASASVAAAPFPGAFSDIRRAAPPLVDRPGIPPRPVLFTESPDAVHGWTGYQNVVSLPSPALASPQYGIVTLQPGSTIRARIAAGKALVWAPGGVIIGSQRVRTADLRHVAVSGGLTTIRANGPAAIGETAAEPVAWRTAGSVALTIRRERPWRCTGSGTLAGRAVIVLRRAWNPHWTLSGTGLRILDRARADGFGNAWLVEGNGPVTVTLEYDGQRETDWLLAISGCLALALLALCFTDGKESQAASR